MIALTAEMNLRFEGLLDSSARCIANLHHREHGWKNAKAGVPRAKTRPRQQGAARAQQHRGSSC